MKRVELKTGIAAELERTCPYCGRTLDNDQPDYCASDDCPRHDPENLEGVSPELPAKD